MYYKENDMQEKASFPIWIGIDVSKDSFTAACRSILRGDETVFPPQGGFAIERKSVKEFMRWAAGVADGFPFGIAMESTGVYSLRLAALIRSVSPAQHVAVCNAASVSLYARSFTEEKNDKADAEAIARYGCDRNPRQPRIQGKEESRLRELVRERDRLVQLKNDMENGGEGLAGADVRRLHASAVKSLGKMVKKLDKLIQETVDSSEEIKEEVARMATAPGVGFLSAACVYAELGSLKNYTRRQISAMSGVCPVNRKSGTSVDRHAMSRRGSVLLRKILFLDSHQAIRGIPAMGEFHKRMLEKPNSSRMSAKCACMRKLLLILHAMVVNGMDFNPNYESEKKMEKSNQPT